MLKLRYIDSSLDIYKGQKLFWRYDGNMVLKVNIKCLYVISS